MFPCSFVFLGDMKKQHFFFSATFLDPSQIEFSMHAINEVQLCSLFLPRESQGGRTILADHNTIIQFCNPCKHHGDFIPVLLKTTVFSRLEKWNFVSALHSNYISLSPMTQPCLAEQADRWLKSSSSQIQFRKKNKCMILIRREVYWGINASVLTLLSFKGITPKVMEIINLSHFPFVTQHTNWHSINEYLFPFLASQGTVLFPPRQVSKPWVHYFHHFLQHFVLGLSINATRQLWLEHQMPEPDFLLLELFHW